MTTRRRRLVAAVSALLTVISLVALCSSAVATQAANSNALDQSVSSLSTPAGARQPWAQPHSRTQPRPRTLSEQTGLAVSIAEVTPLTLSVGQPLTLTGTVTNRAKFGWFDAQVYLSISIDPATTKGGLDAFATTGDAAFGDTIYTIGLFDQIGALRPGVSKPYRLSIPYRKLPISGAPGVYHVGVSVLARAARQVRDNQADARADTLVPLLPTDGAADSTNIVMLLPITAAVVRQPNGTFVDDRLAAGFSRGGRLSNVLDFAAQAPGGTVELVVDPALLKAARDMADGYVVQTLEQSADGRPPRRGRGQVAAGGWLADLQAVATRQTMALLPWANPDASALAEAGMPGIVDVAVQASRRFASTNLFGDTVVDMQGHGGTSRRGLASAQHAGASVHVVPQKSLTKLPPEDVNGYPPTVVTVATRRGPLTTVVSRSDVAGEPFRVSTSGLQLRQDLLAEAAVRSMSSTGQPTSVISAPFGWNPGTGASRLHLEAAFSSPVIHPVSLVTVSGRPPTAYAGPIQVTTTRFGMPPDLLAAIGRLRDTGRVLTELLTDSRQASVDFEQRLATAGSSTWEAQPKRGAALIRRDIRAMAEQVSKVTVTGPAFVALSSQSGRFPLTLTNGLDVGVTVDVDVVAQNPALKVESVDAVQLGPGQRRVIEILTTSEGSGVTQVRARLATSTNRAFGRPWDFNVRATKIGVVIWVFMGVLGAALFSTAGVRIVRRIRAGGFRPRGATSR